MRSLPHLKLLSFTLLITLAHEASGQTVIFSENMGTTGAGSLPSVSTFTAYQNYGCQQYAGTANLSSSSASSGYTGASGSNNVNFNSGSGINLIIFGINTLEYSSMSLSYGIYNSSGLSTGSGMIVDVSSDGVNYTALTRPGTFWLFSGWQSETCTGTIPSTATLYIRFTNASGTPHFRIDDVTLKGTPTASTNPASAYNGWPAAYSFNNWPSSSAAGTYPSNMIFHYGGVNVPQPGLTNITASYNYASGYSLTAVNPCQSLISGQGSNGISFVDRNPGNSTTTGNLGEAVLSLNTTCRSNIQVSWQAGTVNNNGTPYKLLAQYRVGNSGSYTNLPNSAQTQIEYTSPAATTGYGPITLPSACENQALVQLRWAYYYAGTGAGNGDEINLTNLTVSSSPYPLISSVSNQTICNGKTQPAIALSATPAGASTNWTNSNTSIGLAASGTGSIPSFITPGITAPPDKVGTITVTSALNSCTSTINFNITVKGPQSASVWTGASSNDWFDSNNWSNCACGGITSATVPAVTSPSASPVISGTNAGNVASLLLNSGASLSVTSTQTLNVTGNWTNNGVFIAQAGNVVLNGSTAQTLGGTSNTSFYNLTLSNSAGATLSSGQQVAGSLFLNAGTFNTANTLTLAATASGTGKIGPINAAADIINQVTVQQYAPGGVTGWTMLGSPIASALTMADWNDNFAITCLSCPNGALSGFTSIYTYNETIAGSYSNTAKYIPISSISDPLSNGVGYWVYLGTSSNTTSAILFDVTGTVAKSSCLSCGSPVSLPVTRTNNTSAFDDGWNLLANPLPSPISWTALRNGNTNVDNALYVYNTDLNSGNGGYATYINGVSSTTVGGISDTIPICQGFYVHANTSTSLQAGENIKLNGNPALLRTSSVVPKPIVRLLLSDSSGQRDQCAFYFDQGGAASFQRDYDSYKLIFDATQPYIAGMADSLATDINGLPPLYTNVTLPVKAISPSSGHFNIALSSSNFPSNICVTLYDAYTNVTTNLLNSSYSCALYDTTNQARFSLSFYSSPLQGTSSLQDPNCQSPVNGTLTAHGNNQGPWDYEWSSGSSVIRNTYARPVADTLIAPGGNSYAVKINTSGQCDYYLHPFNVNSVTIPNALFSVNHPTAYLSQGGQVNFTNTSGNAQSYLWSFGDGSGSSTTVDPSYNYTIAGQFNARLVAESSGGCLDSATKVITVVNDETGMATLTESTTMRLMSAGPGSYNLVIDLINEDNIDARLFDAGGQLLTQYHLSDTKTGSLEISLNSMASGVYYLSVETGKGDHRSFKLLK